MNYNRESATSILTNAIRRVQFPRSRPAHRASPSAPPQLTHFPSSAAEDAAQFPEEYEVHNTTTAPSSSSDGSPVAAEDADLDVLLRCLEILRTATQVSPQPVESLSTFGRRSTSPERKCSFDPDSPTSDASEGCNGAGDRGHGRGVVGTERTAYSWSPKCAPSLDPPDRFYTPRSSHSP
jgi:hypothetical protein